MQSSSQPSWPCVSYILAQHVLQNELHKRFLTASEQKYFEDATCTLTTWIGFINLSNEIVAFRVRTLLYEQMIPHLFNSKHCCHTFALEPMLDQARKLEMPDQTQINTEWEAFMEMHTKKEQDDQQQQQHQQQDKIVVKTEPGMEEGPKETLSGTKTSEEQTNATSHVPLREVFHTLETDKSAMIEQRKLEEFEAQEELNEREEEKENEAAKSLSMFNADGNFNLKYLLQGIVANRQKTSLSDRELQNLLSDFKPHRSKWANDDRVGQEELYEACEKVLVDLKNYTEHSTPFLNKVNKREAPDYFEVIKKPMDLGTITKKLKNLNYRSKKEFADDLNLIYDNCLIYNTNPASEYRKHANAMKRKTDRLMTRVPDIVIKERIETEIEEEGDEISDEDEGEPRRVSKKSSGKHTVSVERKTTPVSVTNDRRSRERSIARSSSAAPFTTADTPDTDTVMTPDGIHFHKTHGGKRVKKSDHEDDMDMENHDEKSVEEMDDDLAELQDQVWRETTKKTRAKLTTDVEKQYQFSFGEREAIIRSGLDMTRFAMMEHLHNKPDAVNKLVQCESEQFAKWIDRRSGQSTMYDDFDLDSSDDENLDAFFSRKISKPLKKIEDSARTDLFLADYQMTSGLPEVDGVIETLIEPSVSNSDKLITRKSSIDLSPEALAIAQGYSNLSLDIFPQLKFPTYGTNPIIDRNNHKLKQIRHMYSKCNSIKNNIPISTLTSAMEQELSGPSRSNAETSLVVSTSSKIPPFTMDQQSGNQMIQKILSKLLTHAGFEGAKIGALNVLTDIMIDYLVNIGKTLRYYWDDRSNTMDGDEMLIHTLYENGIMDLSELENYVCDEVEKGSGRLDDLHRRLQTSYQELLSGPIEKPTEDEENLLNDEETFITGIFGEDLGEDYFGFRDIGLDKEYNLDALSVPSRLWFGKSKERVQVDVKVGKEVSYKYQPPPVFVPIASDKNIIGLLKPFFEKKLSGPNKPLIEDEYILSRNKNRPRYPPTNRTSASGRKRPSKDPSLAGAAGGDNKKSKRKRPTEEIMAEKAERAEKRRQKLEEKAQRIAEKEQKRKIREELKEQERLAKIEAKEKKKAQIKKAKQAQKSASAPPESESPPAVEEDEQ